jgi:O-antigen/teichoic acid export membrane protein
LFWWGWIKVSSSYLFLALLLALLVAQNMMALLFEAVLQSVNKIYVSKWIRVGRTVLEAGLLYVVSGSQRPEWLLLATLLVNVIFIITLSVVTRREVDLSISLAAFRLKELGGQLRYSFWYFQSMLAAVIAYNVQIVLLAQYLSVGQMTIFLLVFKFFEVIRTAMTNFTQVLFPSISMLQAEQKWSQLLRTFRRVLLRVVGFSLLVFTILLWVGNDFFNWWSGYDTLESNTLFKVYALYVFLLVIDHVSVVFLLGLKFNRLPSIVSTIQSFLSLVATVYFIQWTGLSGAVLASLLLFATTSLIFNPLYVLYQLKQRITAYA